MPGSRWSREQTRARLLSGMEVTGSGCWSWSRFVNPAGYGMTSYMGRRGTPVHRAFYMEFVGEIPADMTIDHVCHNRDKMCPGGQGCMHRRCVNPEHLEAVPASINKERARDGRIPKRKSRPLKTHCPAMHEYTAANTRAYGPRRFCIACQRIKDEARRGSRRSTR